MNAPNELLDAIAPFTQLVESEVARLAREETNLHAITVCLVTQRYAQGGAHEKLEYATELGHVTLGDLLLLQALYRNTSALNREAELEHELRQTDVDALIRDAMQWRKLFATEWLISHPSWTRDPETVLRQAIEQILRESPIDIDSLAIRIAAAICAAVNSEGHSSGYQMALKAFQTAQAFSGEATQ